MKTDLADTVALSDGLAQLKLEAGELADDAAVAIHRNIAQQSNFLIIAGQLRPGSHQRAVVEIDLHFLVAHTVVHFKDILDVVGCELFGKRLGV